MAADLKSASFEGKKEFTLPKGAKVISKEVRLTVKEIENGFILCKSYDIRYTAGDHTDYVYFSKEWYSATNPIEVKIDNKEMSLADKL